MLAATHETTGASRLAHPEPPALPPNLGNVLDALDNQIHRAWEFSCALGAIVVNVYGEEGFVEEERLLIDGGPGQIGAIAQRIEVLDQCNDRIRRMIDRLEAL